MFRNEVLREDAIVSIIYAMCSGYTMRLGDCQVFAKDIAERDFDDEEIVEWHENQEKKILNLLNLQYKFDVNCS